MAKQIKILIILFSISIVYTTCTFEEPDLFDKSAAERLMLAKERYRNALIASPNGWVMDYFPTIEQKGYTFLVKFNENTSAVFAAKNELTRNAYATDTCVFEMIGDNGPVLTFNLAGGNTSVSNVGIFHIFANPEDGYYGQGVGYGGDYEFMTIDETPEKILLKGKKRGVYIELRRMKEGKNWEEYFKDLDDLNNWMFNKKIPRTLLTVNDSIYTLDNGYSHVFIKIPKGGDPITESEEIPFIVTDKGIRFPKKFDINNKKIQTFHLSDDKNSLVCVDEGVNARITGIESVVDCFNNSIDEREMRWALKDDVNTMSPAVRSVYNRVVESFNSKKLTIGQISYLYSSRFNSYAVYISTTTGVFGNLGMDKQSTSIGVNFEYKAALDNNGRTFYSSYDGIADLITLMSGSFKIETTFSLLNPSTVKLTNISNSNIWFLLELI